MSILLYRDTHGRDIEIRNPTIADFGKALNAIADRNSKEINEFFVREMAESPLVKAIDS